MKAIFSERRRGLSFQNRYLALVIISLFSFLSSQAQVLQRDGSYGRVIDRYDVLKRLGIPTFNGAPSTQSTDSSQAALAYDSTNAQFYVYNPKLNTWSVLGGGGGGGGGDLDATLTLGRTSTKIPVVGGLHAKGSGSDSAIVQVQQTSAGINSPSFLYLKALTGTGFNISQSLYDVNPSPYNGNTINDVWVFGSNVKPSSAKLDTTKGSLFWQFEHNYQKSPGSPMTSLEAHIIANLPSPYNRQIRLWSSQPTHDGTSIPSYMTTDDMFWQSSAVSSVMYMRADATGQLKMLGNAPSLKFMGPNEGSISAAVENSFIVYNGKATLGRGVGSGNANKLYVGTIGDTILSPAKSLILNYGEGAGRVSIDAGAGQLQLPNVTYIGNGIVYSGVDAGGTPTNASAQRFSFEQAYTTVPSIFSTKSVKAYHNGTEWHIPYMDFNWTTFDNNTNSLRIPTNTTATRPTTNLNANIYYNTDSGRVEVRKPGGTFQTLAWNGTSGGGGSTSPAGNYGNVQLNRNGAFATPASDSLNFLNGALNVKGNQTVTGDLTVGDIINTNGLPYSGSYDYYQAGGWSTIGADGGAGTTLKLGGYRAGHWQGLEFYTNNVKRIGLDNAGNIEFTGTVAANGSAVVTKADTLIDIATKSDVADSLHTEAVFPNVDISLTYEYFAAYPGVYHVIVGNSGNYFMLPDATLQEWQGKTITVIYEDSMRVSKLGVVGGTVYSRYMMPWITTSTSDFLRTGTYQFKCINGNWHEIISNRQHTFQIDLSLGDYTILYPGKYFVTNANNGTNSIIFPDKQMWDGESISIAVAGGTGDAALNNGANQPTQGGYTTAVNLVPERAMYIFHAIQGEWRTLIP